MMPSTPRLFLALLSLPTLAACSADEDGSSIVAGDLPDTGQTACFDASSSMDCPASGQAFFGQDAQYDTLTPSYVDNADGTVTDLNTGLSWTQQFTETQYDDAFTRAERLTAGGYDDWRVPTIKELYSLMLFSGNTGSAGPEISTPPADAVPFVDTQYFDFEYGQVNRYIDAQYVTSTRYVSTTMSGAETFFGVNFADGRIKGYPTTRPGGLGFYAYFVRGAEGYGENVFVDNGDDTITDEATGLMWMQRDNGAYGHGDATYGGFVWEDGLQYCEQLELSGHDDWRLPDAKELQSIVDYTRSPATTDSAAIDPVFQSTEIIVEDGSSNYPFYWSSTTHVEGQGSKAAYVAFGQAFGFMEGPDGSVSFQDVHGAGCQRSDPKTGDPAAFPTGMGPQGDVIRIYNYVRCVRDAQ